MFFRITFSYFTDVVFRFGNFALLSTQLLLLGICPNFSLNHIETILVWIGLKIFKICIDNPTYKQHLDVFIHQCTLAKARFAQRVKNRVDSGHHTYNRFTEHSV